MSRFDDDGGGGVLFGDFVVAGSIDPPKRFRCWWHSLFLVR